MIRLKDIPDCGICPRCGQPFKVVYLNERGRKFGPPPSKEAFVFECCPGVEVSISDQAFALELRDMLQSYHAQTAGDV